MAAGLYKPHLQRKLSGAPNVMNTMKLEAFILSILVFLSAGAAQAADTPWRGLWEITQQTANGPAEFAAFIDPSGATVDFYGTDWVTLPVAEFKVEGATFLLNWQAKGANVVFEGSRNGERISGKWRLLHPQYHEEGTFAARRTLNVPAWSPLGAVPSGAVADLNSRLAEHGSDLAKYWEETFKSDYWVFFDSGVTAESVRERLKDPDFGPASARLAKALEETSKTFVTKLDGVKLPGPVVLLPFGPADKFRFRFVQDRSFLLVNPVRLLAASQPDPEALARGLLEALAEELIRGGSLTVGLLRAGLPADGLRRLGLAQDEWKALGLSEAEWAEAHGRLDEIKQKIAAKRPLTPTERAVAGVDFVAFLARELSFEAILKSAPTKLDRELGKYSKE